MPAETFFNSALSRLKEGLGLSKDKEIAEALGLSDKALNARKTRDSFPETEVLALSARRPELRLDVTYILTGERVSETQRQQLAVLAAAIEKTGNSELAQQLANAHRTIGATQAQRKPIYKYHLKVLDICDDDDLDLVMRLAVRLASGKTVEHHVAKKGKTP